MSIINFIKVIFVSLIIVGFLHANELNELRILLGDENVIKKEEITKNQELQIVEIEKNQKNEISVDNSKMQYNSLLEAPQEYYTINITTTDGMNSAKKYLKNNNLDEADFYLYPFGPEMKSAKIIYGVFKSVDDAKDAMNKLPTIILENRPYIDNIKKHQKLFLKYN